jgi:hypothetical protein
VEAVERLQLAGRPLHVIQKVGEHARLVDDHVGHLRQALFDVLSNGGRLSGRRALPSTIGSHGLAARPPLPEMRIQEFDRAGWARCWQASPPWPLSMLERRMPVSVHGDDADAAALNQAAAPCLA